MELSLEHIHDRSRGWGDMALQQTLVYRTALFPLVNQGGGIETTRLRTAEIIWLQQEVEEILLIEF